MLDFNSLFELLRGDRDSDALAVWEQRQELDALLGFHPNVIGFGKNSLSLSGGAGPFKRTVRISRPRKNVKVEAHLSHPVNGLPLESRVIPIGKVKKVADEGKAIATALKSFDKDFKREKKVLFSKHEENARVAQEAKSQWMMTI